MKKSYLLIPALALLAVACNKPTAISNQPSTPPLQSTTSDWKVCNNVKDGYTVEYPSNWRIFGEGVGESKIDINCETEKSLGRRDAISWVMFSPDYNFAQTLRVDVTNLKGAKYSTLDGYLKNYKSQIATSEFTKIGDMQTVAFTDVKSYGDSGNQHIIAIRNGLQYDVSEQNADVKMFDSFKASFKFTK